MEISKQDLDDLEFYKSFTKEVSELSKKVYDLNSKFSQFRALKNKERYLELRSILQEKYGFNKILDIGNDDLFFIEKYEMCGRHEGTYYCRRILINLELSKENYIIDSTVVSDMEGNYEYTDYEIVDISLD